MAPSHAGASCKGVLEALTGGEAGWVLSLENKQTWVPTV